MKGFNATPLSFQPEIGSVGTPELASLQRFLSPDHLKAFPTQYSKAIDSAWDYHKVSLSLSLRLNALFLYSVGILFNLECCIRQL